MAKQPIETVLPCTMSALPVRPNPRSYLLGYPRLKDKWNLLLGFILEAET